MQDTSFKLSFFYWKVWTNRLSIVVDLDNWNPNLSQLCSCCSGQARETMKHLFLKEEIATSVWKYFSTATGILGPWIQGKQSMEKWSNAPRNTGQKGIFQDIPHFMVLIKK